MSKTTIRWVKRWGGVEVSEETILPGVYRRKDGGFVVRGSAKDKRTGKLVEVFRHLPEERDPKEALAWLTRERAKVREGIQQQATELLRFTSYAASLMAAKTKSGDHASAATRELWSDVLENHLYEAPFADYYVDQIRTRDILDWRETIKIGHGKGEVSPHTANSWIRILKVIVNSYVGKYELDRNPMLAVPLFDTSKWRGKITKEQPNSLLPHELKMFGELMRVKFPQWYALTVLGFAIGARPSSLRPIRRSGPERDYDPETGELILRRSHTRGEEIMPVTKNGEDVTIVLPASVRAILAEHIDEQLVADDPGDRERPRITRDRMAKSDLLFPAGRTGSFLSTTALWKPFEVVSAAMTEATGGKFKKVITPKAMRRTNKDLMRLCGVRDIVAMAISNHLDDEMHEKYSTVSAGEMTSAVAQVVDLAAFRTARESAATPKKAVAQ